MAPNPVGTNYLLGEFIVKKSDFQDVNNNEIYRNNNKSNVFLETKCSSLKLQKSNVELKEKYVNNGIEYVWRNIILFFILHLGALYGVYMVLFENNYLLYFFAHALGITGGIGVTGGSHRLWAHRAYKAKWPMRFMLMIFQTLAFQNCIYDWVRDHRAHHKFTDTNADPHNSRRGFFFSHMGWLLVKKHPDVRIKGKTIDMSDLDADPIVMFQKKYYMFMMPILCFLVPAFPPYLYWGYTFRESFFICSLLRYVLSLHFTWLVNSAAHMWGYKPYDKNINPTENLVVSLLANGEGYHNYHHVFPWDYKAAELGSYFFNITKIFIDICAKIGLAYDLKTVSLDMIKKRIMRTGDGTHLLSLNNKKTEDLINALDHEKEDKMIWGWDDKDMREDDKNDACILSKSPQ